jgi:FkbM family methyltransferase
MLSLTIPWIWRHPLGSRHRAGCFRRYITWQAYSFLTSEYLTIPWVNSTRLLLKRGMRGATGNYYCGLHEWPDMPFLLHLLRPEDTFADIGANVGTYTVLASGAVGCSTECFEPVTSSRDQLNRQIALNNLAHRVTVHRYAVGAAEGMVRFSLDLGPMNKVVSIDYDGVVASLPVKAIDQFPSLRHSCCWKLDVEGHEFSALTGAACTLLDAPPTAILCEDRSDATSQLLTSSGYLPCTYDPYQRKLITHTFTSGCNQIWIRRLDWVRDRLRTAPPFSVLGELI